MKPTDIRYYPLPNGEFIVSYYDSLRRMRIQKTFAEEIKATQFYNESKNYKPLKQERRSLDKCTTEELLQLYFDEVPDSSLVKSGQLTREFLEQFGLFKPFEIKEVQLRSFYQMQKIEYDYTNHSLSTIKYRIQGFFKWLVFRGLLAESPQSKIVFGRSKIYKRKPIWVKPSAIQKLIEGSKMYSPGFLYPIILLLNETAIRTDEILNLNWSQIDFKNKKISLPENEDVTLRILDLSDDLIVALKRIDQISQYVFTNLESRQLRKEILSRELRALKRQLGLIDSDWVFRDLRFSFAVNFLKEGQDIRILQKTLGHQHLQLTQELFGRFKVNNAELFDLNILAPETDSKSSENDKF